MLIERGDRIALIGPNGVGKSTLMRMLSGVEAPDTGTRTEGHQVVMQYFAQDEATRLDPTLTVYQTLAGDAPIHMVPAIRNILGGFLFSGDDVDKPVRVLSGGERTRLAVARMLLRPSNTLLLDEPTNHLDLDSKDVLLEALEDFGGTLIFVSHDRYFVDKLASKVIEIRDGQAMIYPGNYEEWLWSQKQREAPGAGAEPGIRGQGSGGKSQGSGIRDQGVGPGSVSGKRRPLGLGPGPRLEPDPHPRSPTPEPDPRSLSPTTSASAATRKRARSRKPPTASASASRSSKPASPSGKRPSRPSRRRCQRRGSTTTGRPPQPLIDRHQALMWEVGDLMNQWEALQTEL